MQTVTVLRQLWRLRLMVVVVGLVAVGVAVNVAYDVSPSKLESRKYSVGVATSKILVDTPDSQVVEVAPEGSDSTGVRANLFANLMVDGEIKDVIAKEAGLRPDQLQGVSTTTADPAAAAAPHDPHGYLLTTDVLSSQDGERLPIIEIEAQAPNAARATELATAAITGLRGYLDTRAASEKVADAKRLQVSALGAPQARDVVRGPSLLIAIIAGLFIFAAGCAAVLGFFALVRAWRVAAHEERPSAELDYELILLQAADKRLDTEPREDAPAKKAGGNGSLRGFLRPAPPPPPPPPPSTPKDVDEEYGAKTA